jgi:hypothetical protein
MKLDRSIGRCVAACRFAHLAALALCAAGVITLPAPPRALAGLPPTRAQTLLVLSPDLRTLAAELARYGDSVRTHDPTGAGEARYLRGQSESRAGMADSAIADFERAVAIRNGSDELVALADARLARNRPGDIDRVATLMEQVAPANQHARTDVVYRARLGWAMFLAGRIDSAMRVFRPDLATLENDPLWDQRVGLAAAAANDPDLAIRLLLPVVVNSRGQAKVATNTLRTLVEQKQPGRSASFNAGIQSRVAQMEAADRIWIEQQGGRAMRFTASDGFPVAAAVFAGAGRSRPALVLTSAFDTLSAHDSLTALLRRAGFAVVLVERRGSGGSVGPGCASPADAYGHENAFEARVARDGIEALRVAAKSAALDTSRVMVVGIRESVTSALLAAALNPHARLMMFVSPDPAPVDFGIDAARMSRLALPVFVQTAPEDLDNFVAPDLLYQNSARRLSRVADSAAPGRGAEIFRGDDQVGPRFITWLDYALKAPAAATPRPERR